MTWKPETLGQYHDLWASLILMAPDRFYDVSNMSLVPDQKTALVKEFGRLSDGFHFARKQIKDARVTRIVEELIAMSLESYLADDKKSGAYMLQEARGLVWPSHKLDVKYGVEAERRAFDTNVLYANVAISPYPFEGTADDLGSDQAILLILAERWFISYNEQLKDFRYFSWVMDPYGVVFRTSVEPKEDESPVLKPLQRSWGHKRLKELGQGGAIRACVLMQQMPGLVTFDLEQVERPRVSARQLFTGFGRSTEYGQMRYHLEKPQFIPSK